MEVAAGHLGDSERSLRAAEARRVRALVEGDWDTFGQLCDDRLVYTHSVGRRDSKESLLESLCSGTVRYYRIEHDLDAVVRVGDAAWVSGRMRAEITSRGQERQLDTLTTSVWIRSSREWKLLAFHTTARAG
ncbi:nuclear transport factor 2 family protein [Arthrobacter sp. I2-34]|uniref:Nuclear transport factor 2 family protein n=1 Tax=Arthrobacter hankyongi TaxID=2904801 RepID=A0ABS9L432_9MICC|nr:nuclear transport factor 2 family protein [Arthrobacter hankyongi]MCG2621447.1 nuclear transport factor 2 family protein [Arthrobacter hankyongi]